MKICGIILAKENSNRFPGKNYYEVDGKPMFMHGVELLNKFISGNNIFIFTNSEKVYMQTKLNQSILNFRSINSSHDEQPYLDILRTSYMRLFNQYDIIISVLANSINHNPESIKQAIEIMRTDNTIDEVRSFDSNGKQSGIFIFREKFLLDFNTTLHPIAAIHDNGREIHYKSELPK